MSHLDDLTADLDRRLADADEQLATLYPGDRGVRQPVHTVYVPADLFTHDLAQQWGRQANAALAEHGVAPTRQAGPAVLGARDPAGLRHASSPVTDSVRGGLPVLPARSQTQITVDTGLDRGQLDVLARRAKPIGG